MVCLLASVLINLAVLAHAVFGEPFAYASEANERSLLETISQAPLSPRAVLYIKTYKTASSTLAALLVRYAAEQNLTAWGGVFAHCRVEAIPTFQVETKL
jgi:uncharacterized membrane protein